jgi:hypothetical protein
MRTIERGSIYDGVAQFPDGQWHAWLNNKGTRYDGFGSTSRIAIDNLNAQLPSPPRRLTSTEVEWEIYPEDRTYRKTYQDVTAIIVPVTGKVFMDGLRNDACNGLRNDAWAWTDDLWAVYFTRDNKTLKFFKVYESLGTAKAAAGNKLSWGTTRV